MEEVFGIGGKMSLKLEDVGSGDHVRPGGKEGQVSKLLSRSI
jgi:hypothetical protein